LEAIAELEKERVQKIAANREQFPIPRHPGWIWIGIMVAVASVVAMTMWHFFGEPGKIRETFNRTRIVSQPAMEPPKPASNDNATNRKAPVPTEDGATLHFIPAGSVKLAENIGGMPSGQLTVHPFYMDESQVTNHQYVEFLNHHLSQLEVARGVVRVDDEIWLMLGEIYEGYKPIVFKNGEFKVNNAIYTSFPVLRVTAYGAAAYARFYSRRLPTSAEWLYVLDNALLKQDKKVYDSGEFSREKESESMHGQMHGQPQTELRKTKISAHDLSPVTSFAPNRYGIRGLGKNITERGLWFPQPASLDNMIEAVYAVLPEAVVRQPWEAFERVGFRCVREINIQAKGEK
jgi:serine/threonine-protein kinase